MNNDRFDTFGIPIKIGDIVVFRNTNKKYNDLCIGIIEEFTPKATNIKMINTKIIINRPSSSIIRYNEQIKYNKELFPELYI